jgi:hypothetical protein
MRKEMKARENEIGPRRKEKLKNREKKRRAGVNEKKKKEKRGK